MDVAEGVIVHGLLEVDGIENLNAVRLIDHLAVFVLHGLIDRIAVPVFYRLMVLAQLGTHFGCAALEHLTALHQNRAFRVRDHIGAVHLHQIRLQPEAGLAGAAAADDQHIFVSGCLWVLGAAVHGQAFRFRQNHIVLEHRVHIRSDVLRLAPAGRTVLHIMAVLLGVFTFQVHRQPKPTAAADAHQQIQRVQAGPPAGQRRRQRGEEREHFSRSVCALCHAPRLTEVGGKQPQQDIRQIQNQELFDVQRLFHRSSSFRLVRSTTAFLTSSLN